MDNIFKNRFKKILDIVLESKLNINGIVRKIWNKAKEEPFKLKFTKNDTEEEYKEKLLELVKNSSDQDNLVTVFDSLINCVTHANYPNVLICLLSKVEEKYIIKAFDSVVKHDDLHLCESFLNNNDKRFKNIISLDSDYQHFLNLSVKHGAKEITEYFLKEPKFTKLLTNPITAGTLLQHCLISNHIEIANMLLSQDINLGSFQNKNSIALSLEIDAYSPAIIKQIQKRLIHDELIIELETIPTTKPKKMKL